MGTNEKSESVKQYANMSLHSFLYRVKFLR